MNADSNYSELEELSRRGRWLVLSTVAGSGAGHVGGPMSAMDVLISLFFRGMDIKPEEPGWPERDRFILSKGHAAIGLYTGMALRGFFPIEELKTFDKGISSSRSSRCDQITGTGNLNGIFGNGDLANSTKADKFAAAHPDRLGNGHCRTKHGGSCSGYGHAGLRTLAFIICRFLYPSGRRSHPHAGC